MRLLKDTFSTDSVLPENSIQAGFGGCRCIPTIIKADESITHLGNLVAMQVNKTHAVDVSDFSVVALPINTFGDGSVHLAFDLAHGVGFVWFLFILVGQWGHPCPPLCHYAKWANCASDEGAMWEGDPQER